MSMRAADGSHDTYTHRLSDTLNVVAKNLAVTLGSAPVKTVSLRNVAKTPNDALSETLSTFAASRHVSTPCVSSGASADTIM